MNDPELQTWIEVTHGPLVEVNDAARRQRPDVIDLHNHLLSYGLDQGILWLRAIMDPTEFLTQTGLDGGRPGKRIVPLAGGSVPGPLPPSGPERGRLPGLNWGPELTLPSGNSEQPASPNVGQGKCQHDRQPQHCSH